MLRNQRQIMHKPTYAVEYGKLTMSEGVGERRNIIAVFITLARLNKHPTLYLIYLKLLVERKGMLFTIDKEPLATDSTYTSTRDRGTDYMIHSMLNAQNKTVPFFSQMHKRKKKGQTTAKDNANCQRYDYEAVCIGRTESRRYKGFHVWRSMATYFRIGSYH